MLSIMAYHTFSNTFDQEDEVYQIDLTGSGEAYVFRDWLRDPGALDFGPITEINRLLLTTLNGAPIYLRPGITFYESARHGFLRGSGCRGVERTIPPRDP